MHHVGGLSKADFCGLAAAMSVFCGKGTRISNRPQKNRNRTNQHETKSCQYLFDCIRFLARFSGEPCGVGTTTASITTTSTTTTSTTTTSTTATCPSKRAQNLSGVGGHLGHARDEILILFLHFFTTCAKPALVVKCDWLWF